MGRVATINTRWVGFSRSDRGREEPGELELRVGIGHDTHRLVEGGR